MPIKPENEALYPGGSIRSPEWLAIRAGIQTRAGDRCEACGVANGAIGIRFPGGEFMETPGYKPGDDIRLLVTRGLGHATFKVGMRFDLGPVRITDEVFRVIKIVCTVAHLDQKLVDHSPENLRFLCQRDHNILDAPARAVNAAATRKANKPVTLLDLMEARDG